VDDQEPGASVRDLGERRQRRSGGATPANGDATLPGFETRPAADGDELPLWHVTVTFAGAPTDPVALRESLRTLQGEQPFLATTRYAADRAEISYWDEAEDIDDAAALGLRLWAEHRRSAILPDWHPVGLEVVDRDTLHARGDRLPGPARVGDLRPL
jgi:hypothetical protein